MISKEKIAAICALEVDGHIEPRDVIAAARDAKNPLHDEFEWNVSKAAEANWIDTACRLIRFVKIEVETTEHVFRAVRYVVDPDRQPRSRAYVDLTVAGRTRAKAREIMAAELERIVQAIRRAREIALVLGLEQELDDLLADTTRIRAMAERKRAKKGRSKPKRSTSRRSAHGELRV